MHLSRMIWEGCHSVALGKLLTDLVKFLMDMEDFLLLSGCAESDMEDGIQK